MSARLEHVDVASPRARVAARDTRLAAALALMLASGIAGLGDQIVWARQGALWLGHEAPALLAVVAAFFGGLALGAQALGTRIERSARPLQWYAACEAVIAVWSLLLVAVMPHAADALLALTGTQPTPAWQWGVAFGGTFVLLLPATAAMGATLPAMEAALAPLRQRGSLAALYAANTLGAVLGVLAVAFWAVPAWGLSRTAMACAALNGLCAVVAWRRSRNGDAVRAELVEGRAQRERSLSPMRGTLAVLGVTGLLGIGYEVLVVRVLSQVAEDTVYTFAMLLAIYLVGSALGAAALQRAERRGGDMQRRGDRLCVLLALACLLGTAALWEAPAWRDAVQRAVGDGMPAALAGEAAVAIAAFLLPTLAMGALFSHLGTRAVAQGYAFGRALAVNTAGAALAPLVFGVWLLPAVGAKASLLLIAAAYLPLALRRTWREPLAGAAAGIALALAIWAPPLAFVDVPDGGRIVSYHEGASAAVSVVEDAHGVARLRIDNRQQEGSSASLYADARQALLPLLLHPAPHRALFLGLGTGVTAASAAEDPGMQVQAVELLPEVIAASAHFRGVVHGDSPATQSAMSSPRLRIVAADARRYVRASTERFDLIVSDNFHPARSGSGALYTVEHFLAVKARLAADGVFCQWLPLHQLDLGTLRSIVRSFLAAYPNAVAMLATNSLETPVIGLVGRTDDGHFDLAALRTRLAGAAEPLRLAPFGLADEFALLGSVVAGPRSLAAFSAGVPLNTDDHPVVAYLAPRITYAADSLPRERLIAVLAAWQVEPEEIVGGPLDAAWRTRLVDYGRARNAFIRAGRDVQPSDDVQRMLAQVREPLLALLRRSPDFRPAYDPLLRMALVLADRDAAQASALLEELARVQPARPEAAEALRTLAAARR